MEKIRKDFKTRNTLNQSIRDIKRKKTYQENEKKMGKIK